MRERKTGPFAITGLTKFFGKQQALNNMTFTVEPGEMFGFVGSNGAGKTTTMRIALGVLSSDGGTVTWDGKPVDDAARNRIGYMPEERGLYPSMKVGEQLTYLAQLRGLSLADAKDRMLYWTDRLGVAERHDDAVQKLSLGNQQRVQLAAALVHDPDLMVLDEPFSGLDPVAVDVMSQVLQERTAEGVSVLFSSHQLDLVERLCDRVCIVRAGTPIALGETDVLRRGTQQLWQITVEGASANWLSVSGLTAISTVETAAGSQCTVDLAGRDPQALLQAGLAAGRVTQFGEYVPSLTELYRNVVAHEPALSSSTTQGDQA